MWGVGGVRVGLHLPRWSGEASSFENSVFISKFLSWVLHSGALRFRLGWMGLGVLCTINNHEAMHGMGYLGEYEWVLYSTIEYIKGQWCVM